VACRRVGQELGISADTLRGWVKQSDIDTGRRPGVSSAEGVDPPAGEGERRAAAGQCDPAYGVGFFRGRARPPLSLVVAYISGHRHRFGVEPICRTLRQVDIGVSASGYYAALARPPAARTLRDAWLEEQIQSVYKAGGELYGARKVWAQLNRQGVAVARCTVERLMARLGLHGVVRGPARVRTTVTDPAARRPPDRVGRVFTACAPNRLWVLDFTYVATWRGMTYTAFVIDAYARCIIGWKADAHHRVELVTDALEMAIAARARAGHPVAGTVHHSDAGAEYLAIRYTTRLEQAGLVPSVGSVADPIDNALAETIIGLYKTELIAQRRPWLHLSQVETATSAWVGWYNQLRLMGPIGYRPPAEVEDRYWHRPPCG
jgi:putative transposase